MCSNWADLAIGDVGQVNPGEALGGTRAELERMPGGISEHCLCDSQLAACC